MATPFQSPFGRQQRIDLEEILIGQSQAAQNMRSFARRVASTEASVLLQGETGCGKDHMAEVIHKLSSRGGSGGAFVTVDCGSMTETLWESEMFGHTRGAFTDARVEKKGLVEIAEGGTLFFDEIGNMSLALQARLLRIVEKKPYRPLGSTKEKTMNFRVIVATNVDLKSAVRKGLFREDLFHRVNVLSLNIPPLRARTEDIPLLASHFLRVSGSDKKLTLGAEKALMQYEWLGNVRELWNVMIRADFNANFEDEIKHQHVSPCLDDLVTKPVSEAGDPLSLPFHELKKLYFEGCFRRAHYNYKEGAQLAGLTVRVFTPIVKSLGLNKPVTL